MDWHELEKMKVTELRTLAKEKTGLEGVSGMSKDHLVEAVAKALGIHKPHKVAHGHEKTKIKQQIRALKAKRDEALKAKNRDELKDIHHLLHRLKRRLRRHADLTTA